MAVKSIPCPTPGCGETIEVRTTSTGKPTGFCDRCRFQFFVKSQYGAAAWLGTGKIEQPEKKEPPKTEGVTPGRSSSAPGVTPPGKPPAPPAAPAPPKKKDLWDL